MTLTNMTQFLYCVPAIVLFDNDQEREVTIISMDYGGFLFSEKIEEENRTVFVPYHKIKCIEFKNTKEMPE